MKVKLTTFAFAAFLFSYFCYTPTLQACNTNGVQWVTNTADEGPGSLRAAIDCANSQVGADTIRFALPGTGPFIIFVGSTTGEALPALLDAATIIDGSSQAGYQPGTAPLIILDGSQPAWDRPINALWVRADRSEIYGLEIRNFPDDGIDIRAADAVQIGALGRGNVIHSNGWALDYFPGSPGTGPWEGCGIVLRRGASNCRIFSNIIGTDYSQTLALGNEYCGIVVQDGGDGHLIGGGIPGEGNVIAHNAAGLRIGSGSTACSMLRNHLFCNDSIAIDLRPGANNNLASPVITNVVPDSVVGQAISGQQIQVFVNDPSACATAACQGRFYLGSTTVVNGRWSLSAPYDLGYVLTGGEIVTAIATDASGNSSELSSCRVVSGNSNCTDPNGIIWVTNTNDDGLGSLRAAIECANATSGANRIHFNIPGNGPHTIAVGSTTGEPLFPLTSISTILDATTQAGYGQNGNYSPQIILDGRFNTWTAPINALWIRAAYCEVYGFEIRGFPDDGIDVTGASYVTIGSPNKGNVIYGNGADQDYFPDAPNTGPWNGCGIVLKSGAHHCTVQANILGTDYEGNRIAPNELCGIVVLDGGDLHQLGGLNPGEGNRIAHHEEGIRINSNSYGCSIVQNEFYCNTLPINLIGNANLALAPPQIDSASTVFIGGTGASTDVVDVYLESTATCNVNSCQGASWLGRAEVINGRWALSSPFIANLQPVQGEQITALATDTLGNSSTFSNCTVVKRACLLALEIEQLTNASCNQANGAVEIAASGGWPPVAFTLNGLPQLSSSINGLAAGSYTIIATDDLGCKDTLIVQVDDTGIPALNLLSQSDASCGLPSGTLEVEGSGGQSPYTYDIGSGPVSSGFFNALPAGSYTVTLTDATACTNTLNIDIDDTAGPILSINNIQHASCGQADGAFSVTASGGTPPYTYNIGNGPTSDTLFTGLMAGLYTLILSDANNCVTTASVIIDDQVILPQAGFSFSADADTLHFNNLTQNGVSYNWTFGDGLASNATSPSHLYPRNDVFEVCLTATNACGTDIYCETINVVFPLRISGMILREDGVGVGNTLMSLGGLSLLNNMDGNYLVSDLPPGVDYTAVPDKNINWKNGLTTFDVYLIQQHILAISTLGSPYQMIAADANRSGTITTFDLYQLRQLILGVTDEVAGNTSWRFVPADYVFSNPSNPFQDNFPDMLQFNALDRHQLNQDFIAIKIGDVNLSNDPANLQIPEKEMIIRLDAAMVEEGEYCLLDFRADEFEQMVGLQFDLQFDPKRFQYEGLSTVGLEGFGEEHIGSHQSSEGRLSIAWNEMQGRVEGCQLEEDALLFQLRFRTRQGTSGLDNAFQLTKERSIARAFQPTGEGMDIQLQYHQAVSTTTTSAPVALELAPCYPNPFYDQSRLRFFLPEAGKIQFILSDASGKIFWQEQLELAAGWHDKWVDRKRLQLADGLYWLQINTPQGGASTKLVVQSP